MIDRKTEADIKAVKSFLEVWAKFHSIYNQTVSKEIISQEDEVKFLETKDIVKNKYGTLKNALEFRYTPHARPTDPVEEALGLNSIRFISEKNISKVNDDWRDSYIFLNSVLEQLKNNKKKFGRFSPIGVFFKRVFRRR